MKKYLSIAIALLIATMAFAGVYTIGTGTAGAYTAPFNGLWDNNWSKVIYTQAEINAAGLTAANTITGIAFNVTNTPSNYTMLDQRVYVRHTSAAAYDASDIDHPSSALFDAVYQGDLTYNGSGWFTIAFSTPFAWNGTDNIEFLFENHNGGWTSGYPNFAYTSTSPNYLTVHKAQDASFPQGIDGTRIYNRPNIQLYTPMVDPPNPTTAISPANGATFVNAAATLNWQASFGADGYKLYFGSTNPPDYIGDLGNVTTYNPNGLADGSTYYWQVVPYNAYGDATGCPVWSFATTPAGAVVIGDGTVTSRFPLGSYYGYERSASLYTATELGAGNKRINTLGWYTTMASNDAVPTKIYLKSYAGSTVTADTWENLITGATPVYDATITSIPANDWYMVTLDNSFDLDAGENLLVLVERNFGGGGGSAGSTAPAIRATTISNMHQTILADTNPPTGTTSAQTTRPNLMLLATSYTISDPPNPAIAVSPADQATGIDPAATLNWISGGGAPTGYKLYFGNSNPPAYIGDMGDALSYNPTLAYSSTYYWQVIPYNSNGEASNCPIWSFSTLADPTISSFPFIEGFESGYTNGASDLGNWTQLVGPEYSSVYWTANNTETSYNRSPRTGDWNAYLRYAGQATLVRPIQLEAGTGYQIEFYARQDTDTSTGALIQAKLGTAPTLAALTTQIIPQTGLVSGDYQKVSGTFSVDADGIYYIGIQGWLNYTPWYISLDDIKISEMIAGPPAIPTLTYPADTATNMPADGFNLTWQPDLDTGGVPTYYAVFMSQDEESIFDDHYFEVDDPFFNPVTDSEGEIVFAYEDRWYWTVAAGNGHGESDPAEIQSFQIEADPTIRNFPWTDGFESYADFSLDLRPWSQYDGDGMTTWGVDSFTFPNQYYVGSFIAFNPNTTTPAAGSGWAPHGGSKYAAAFDANGAANNDWLITPPIQSPGALKFGFWARSVTDNYGLERFNVLMSTTDKNPASFTLLNEDGYIEAPVAWTKYEYSVNVPANQIFYLAIQCVSDDAFAFFVDDVEIVVPQNIDLAINGFTGDSLGKVNSPAMYEVIVANVGLTDVAAYTVYLKDADTDAILAQKQVTELLEAGDSSVQEISWTPTLEGDFGVYAEVFTSGDGNLANNVAAPIEITVYSENMQILYVGDPETTWVTWAMPFNFYYEDSVAETIYLASEMQATSGTIEALVYTNYFDTADVEYFQIWMQNTNVNDLTTGWLPWENYTLVYDGPVGGPAGLNLIQIPITPFTYTGGNLAIRTSRDWTGDWASSKQWLITVDENYPNRSRVVYQDTEYMDHTNPPAGSVSNNIPNVIFFMESEDMVTTVEAPEIDIAEFGDDLTLGWPAVPYAYSYNVYATDDPYLFGDEPTTVYTNSYILPNVEDAEFYRITANTYHGLARGSFNRPDRDSGKFQEVDQPVFKQPRYQRAK